MPNGGTMTMADVSGSCTDKNSPSENNVLCPLANTLSCALLLWDFFSLPGSVFLLLHQDGLSRSTKKLAITCSWSSRISLLRLHLCHRSCGPVAIEGLYGCICFEVDKLCSLFFPTPYISYILKALTSGKN